MNPLNCLRQARAILTNPARFRSTTDSAHRREWRATTERTIQTALWEVTEGGGYADCYAAISDASTRLFGKSPNLTTLTRTIGRDTGLTHAECHANALALLDDAITALESDQ